MNKILSATEVKKNETFHRRKKIQNIEFIKHLENFKIINDRLFDFRWMSSTGNLLSYVFQIGSNTIEK